MVERRIVYDCEKCGETYDDERVAERHEQKPIIDIPKGFIYLSHSFRENGWIRGSEEDINGLHDVRYSFISFLGGGAKAFAMDGHYYSLNASSVREGLEDNRYRFATEEDIERVLSHEGIVEALISQKLTELTLDLEGKRTVPIPVIRISLSFGTPYFSICVYPLLE